MPEAQAMSQDCVLAIDQGTTSSRCIIFDSKFQVVASAQEEFPQYYPNPGWCEHDPEEILASVVNCFKKLPTDAVKRVKALGVTNQRETTVAWARDTGKPLHKALVWLDTRTAGVVAKTIKENAGQNDSGDVDVKGQDCFRAKVGLPVSTYFSGMKIRWLLENSAEVKTAHDAGNCCFGTIDAWLIYNLTGGASDGGKYVTDVSNAGRYLLMNLESKSWDESILKALGIKKEALPSIVSNVETESFGKVSGKVFEGLAGIPITGCLGDQHAALVGQTCFAPGECKNTYGTGCFLIVS